MYLEAMHKQLNEIKELLAPFKQFEIKKYWADFLTSILLGWGAFIYSLNFNFLSAINTILLIISALSLYRATCFIHEIVHFPKKLDKFKLAFNFLVGFALNYPVVIYNLHNLHHGKKTYGTKRDPEFSHLKKDSVYKIFAPFWLALIFPIFGLIRYGLAPLLYPIMGKKLRDFFILRQSVLAIDLSYIRPIKNARDYKRVIANDLLCCLYKWAMIFLILFDIANVQLLFSWMVIISIAGFLNLYRAKINHRYVMEPTRPNELNMFLDSITVEGNFLSDLWSPIGLRFHSIHHLMPDIPYYNMAKSHKILKEKLPKNHLYFHTVEPSLISALYDHYEKLKEFNWKSNPPKRLQNA